MARTNLCRRTTEKHPRKPPVKLLCNWLHFGEQIQLLSAKHLMTFFLVIYSLYSAAICLGFFLTLSLSLYFICYIIDFCLYFRIFLFYFHFQLVTYFGLYCYQSSFWIKPQMFSQKNPRKTQMVETCLYNIFGWVYICLCLVRTLVENFSPRSRLISVSGFRIFP